MPPPNPLSPKRPPPSAQYPIKAAEPRHGASFDPWNLSSTGHQRAENRLGASTEWRESRTAKLQSQFRGGASGGQARISDSIGTGAKDWDPKVKALVTPEVRARARSSVLDMLAKPGTMKASLAEFGGGAAGKEGSNLELGERLTEEEKFARRRKVEDERSERKTEEKGVERRKMLEGVMVYVNGSTHPLISDHKLKQLLAENGARMSIRLGRRQVTHVILGRPASGGTGAGGGLAGAKLQREIQKVGGCGVKYVGVEWILESIKAGKRLPEARFSNLKLAAKGQKSVFGWYSKPGASRSTNRFARGKTSYASEQKYACSLAGNSIHGDHEIDMIEHVGRLFLTNNLTGYVA
ncbi:uncharacterized protein BCR38DRAFT_461432 [Pseudomassariella vexata]|uniref:BRCT domain-containing protein n=1 Tax=Pseudomassariella vexata TaxID=1141098 RepID=A0A1Y2DF58_9PEZI|nr:uncharacterized protein BCR38DRAFT_461432 [Pseudomassariella vexata]ORY57305.1 hypothetical protein BCR38DRAFT_461432 [Pseudomassariella vexata]